MGRLADLSGPPELVQRAVETFVRVYGVDLSEAEVPDGGYPSFDAFFTRCLVPGSRPVPSDAALAVCPADGMVAGLGRLESGNSFEVKGRLYGVADLLADPSEAGRYDGGTYLVTYLAPPDYHRVHAPVDGRVSLMRHVEGTLYPVNTIGMRHVPRLFVENERVVLYQESEMHGCVATVLVGAIGVGRIELTFEDVLTNTGKSGGERDYGESGPMLGRGDELGMFHLGSTVITFFERSIGLELMLEEGARTRVGEAMARGELA